MLQVREVTPPHATRSGRLAALAGRNSRTVVVANGSDLRHARGRQRSCAAAREDRRGWRHPVGGHQAAFDRYRAAPPAGASGAAAASSCGRLRSDLRLDVREEQGERRTEVDQPSAVVAVGIRNRDVLRSKTGTDAVDG